jgi:hypothetical protein
MTLVTVQGTIRLDSRAAAAWSAMVAACAKATGVTLRITSPYGGYRSLAQQWEMWNDRTTSTTGQVAYPGTSVHGSGLCVDISNWGLAAEWVRRNARTYGFSRTIPTEPWHFEHNGTTTAGGGSAHISEPEEDDMARTSQAHYDDAGKTMRIAFVPGTPWYLEWNEGTLSTIANALASSQDTGNSIPITKSMRDAIVAAANRVQAP